jgi:hypothetical protein
LEASTCSAKPCCRGCGNVNHSVAIGHEPPCRVQNETQQARTASDGDVVMTWEECKPAWVGDMLHKLIHIAVYDEQLLEDEVLVKTEMKWKR